MGFDELFVRFWWLMFPLFGMVMAFWGMASSERRSRRAMDVVKSYVEQGKEPPAEIMDIASGGHARGAPYVYRGSSPGWRVVTYTALAVAAALGSRMMHQEGASNWLFIGAVFFGVLALGSFFMLMFGSRPEK